MMLDATSAGFPAGDIFLNVYDYCATEASGGECRDGFLDPGEVCDDGNNMDCDGCRGDCSAVETGCGDGFVCGTETCDDGNIADCDGCRGDCSAVENGCGDGFLCGGEGCDDGNNVGGDGCSGACSDECGDGTCDHDDTDSAGYVESNDTCPPDCFCGDGVLDTSEECDDGNTVDGDGCSSGCVIECGWECMVEPSVCTVIPPLPADPPNDRLKNRYISFNPNNPCLAKLKVTLTGSLPHPGLVEAGSSWWVLAPIVADAANPKPLLAPGECVALLGPENMAAEIDWDAAGCQVLHVTGCPIEPTSRYDVQAVNGTTESPALSVATILQPGQKWWCDTVGFFTGPEGEPPYVWTAPQGVVNFDDVYAAMVTWQGGQVVPPGPIPPGNVAHLSAVDVEPGDINTVVNFADVLILIKAFQGDPYPFGPADSDGKCP